MAGNRGVTEKSCLSAHAPLRTCRAKRYRRRTDAGGARDFDLRLRIVNRKRLICAALWATSLIVAVWCGSNWYSIAYFNDDLDVAENLLSEAKRAMPDVDGHPDFFRSRSFDCVRFMPARGVYGHVMIYCKDRQTGSVVKENY